jgi:hypothetical protein
VTQGSPEVRAFYIDALTHLSQSKIPFLVGGALALAHYTRIERQTKDVDLFLRSADIGRALDFFRGLGYRADVPFPHWLGKVYCDNEYLDLIFGSGNGVTAVDNGWFEHSVETEILGVAVRLCPPEETLWSKAFVQERERFDGADVLHLLHRLGPSLDWHRLLSRFGPHWRVLFAHVVMFGFVYPDQRHRIPAWVVDELTTRFIADRSDSADAVCNGTLLSREQYLHDLTRLAYDDARIEPRGRLTHKEVAIWTAAIGDKE